MSHCENCARSYHIPVDRRAREFDVFDCEFCGERVFERKGWPRRALAAMRRSAAPLTLIALASLSTAAIGARAAIVSRFPEASSLYAAIGLPVNLRGLAIENLRASLVPGGDKSLLVVEGEIANLTTAEAATPDLAVTLRGPDGNPLYEWTAHAPKARLLPGERVPFRTRLASPPTGVADALVKFAAVGDKESRTGDGS